MARPVFFPFHPERLLRQGAIVLGLGACIAIGELLLLRAPSSTSLSLPLLGKRVSTESASPLTFSLHLQAQPPVLPVPHVEKEMIFSFDPERPDAEALPTPLVVRLPKSQQMRRVALSSRIDLAYTDGSLSFSSEESPFWVELQRISGGQIEGKICMGAESRSFAVPVQESPLRSAQELEEGSPFRVLAEARSWGPDLCREKYGNQIGIERIEVGPLANPELLELGRGDWLVWKGGRWTKGGSPTEEKDFPIARIASKDGRALILEGWNEAGYLRCALAPFQPAPLRVKAEELFSAVRIRSEKQVSCLLEKQCLILKVGDWALKNGNRWKILRKPEEQEAFLQGQWFGELFVLERIEAKGGGKVIQGSLFNAARSQVMQVEVPVGTLKKSAQMKRGKSK